MYRAIINRSNRSNRSAQYDSGQQVGQQFTSDEWFDLSQITKAQFSLKRAASVDSSLIIKCWLVNQADLDTSATLESFAKGQLGGSINVENDVGTSFGFVTFEGSGLPLSLIHI